MTNLELLIIKFADRSYWAGLAFKGAVNGRVVHLVHARSALRASRAACLGDFVAIDEAFRTFRARGLPGLRHKCPLRAADANPSLPC